MLSTALESYGHSITASILRCHRGDRGSIPRDRVLFLQDRKHSETQKIAPFSVVRALALDVDSRERFTRTIMDINENVQNDNGNVMKKCFHSSTFNIFGDFLEKSRRFDFEVCFLNFQIFSLNFEKIFRKF